MNTEYTQFVAYAVKAAGEVKLYQAGRGAEYRPLYGSGHNFYGRAFKRLQTPRRR